MPEPAITSTRPGRITPFGQRAIYTTLRKLTDKRARAILGIETDEDKQKITPQDHNKTSTEILKSALRSISSKNVFMQAAKNYMQIKFDNAQRINIGFVIALGEKVHNKFPQLQYAPSSYNPYKWDYRLSHQCIPKLPSQYLRRSQNLPPCTRPPPRKRGFYQFFFCMESII